MPRKVSSRHQARERERKRLALPLTRSLRRKKPDAVANLISHEYLIRPREREGEAHLDSSLDRERELAPFHLHPDLRLSSHMTETSHDVGADIGQLPQRSESRHFLGALCGQCTLIDVLRSRSPLPSYQTGLRLREPRPNTAKPLSREMQV